MIIALNNKSNLEKDEFINYIKDLSNINTNNNKVILFPTYLNIPLFNNPSIELGSQDVSSRPNGSYTGEISASQLKSYNVKYSLVGHSERRIYQKEPEEEIKLKIKELLNNKIVPILCIGETEEQKKLNITREVIKNQLSSLENIDEINKIIIAYEPVWSIGTNLIPSNEEINNVTSYIKQHYPNNYVLYGGSVNNENIDILNNIKSIDGYLIGGLSLKIDKLQELINKCS